MDRVSERVPKGGIPHLCRLGIEGFDSAGPLCLRR
jgi:hypothetical protein